MNEIPGVRSDAHCERQKSKLTLNSSSTQFWTFTDPPAGKKRVGKVSATTQELLHFRTLGRLPGPIAPLARDQRPLKAVKSSSVPTALRCNALRCDPA